MLWLGNGLRLLITVIQGDGMDRAGGGSPFDLLTHMVIGRAVIFEGFFAMETEDVGGEKDALSIALTARQVDDHSQVNAPFACVE